MSIPYYYTIFFLLVKFLPYAKATKRFLMNFPINPPTNPEIRVAPNVIAIITGIKIRIKIDKMPPRAEVKAAKPLAIPQVELRIPLVKAANVALIGPIPVTTGRSVAVQSKFGVTRETNNIATTGKIKVKNPALAPLPFKKPDTKPAINGAIKNKGKEGWSVPIKPTKSPTIEPVMF
jgi:hypothetical protein